MSSSHDSSPLDRPREARSGRHAPRRRHHGRRQSEQAKIAEDSGAVAVMALERVPSDIRRTAAWRAMSDPEMIQGSRPGHDSGHGQGRIGHFAEAQILEALDVDYIDESEVLTPADEENTSTSGASPCPSCAARRTWRGAAAYRRGRVPYSFQGRGRYRQRRRSGATPSHDQRPDAPTPIG